MRYPLTVRLIIKEYEHYVHIQIHSLHEELMLLDMFDEGLIEFNYASENGHTVTLLYDVYELKKYIREIPELLALEGK